MKSETKGTLCVMAVVTVIGFVLAFTGKFDRTIPSEEQKPKEQVTTEVNTHVIRCTAYVNETCTEYKIYKIVKE